VSIFVRALFRPRYLELDERQWTDIQVDALKTPAPKAAECNALRACLISKWDTFVNYVPHDGAINCIASNDDNKRATIARQVKRDEVIVLEAGGQANKKEKIFYISILKINVIYHVITCVISLFVYFILYSKIIDKKIEYFINSQTKKISFKLR